MTKLEQQILASLTHLQAGVNARLGRDYHIRAVEATVLHRHAESNLLDGIAGLFGRTARALREEAKSLGWDGSGRIPRK